MRIIHLKAENVQRLKAVQVHPKGSMVVVGGRNAQGKTSLLDSIMMAFAGKKALSDKPVREGAEEARIELQTEEFTLTRTIQPDGRCELEVKDVDGRPSSGTTQTLLNKIFSQLTFDPLAFSNMKKDGQVEVLKSLIPFDFSAHEKFRKQTFDERTYVNRELKQKQAENEANPWEPSAPIDPEPADGAILGAALERQKACSELQLNVVRGERRIQEIDDEIASLVAKKKEIGDWLTFNKPKLEEFGDVDAQVREAQGALATVNERNARIRKNADAKRIYDEKKKLEAKSNELTATLERMDREKIEAIKAAPLPVAGLAFDEGRGVLFNSIPFAQLSGAEKLKVSLAMGIALNPSLRVLLIRDGSLLDDSSLGVVAALAEQHDMQVWMERVGSGPECSVIIEDGNIVEER